MHICIDTINNREAIGMELDKNIELRVKEICEYLNVEFDILRLHYNPNGVYEYQDWSMVDAISGFSLLINIGTNTTRIKFSTEGMVYIKIDKTFHGTLDSRGYDLVKYLTVISNTIKMFTYRSNNYYKGNIAEFLELVCELKRLEGIGGLLAVINHVAYRIHIHKELVNYIIERSNYLVNNALIEEVNVNRDRLNNELIAYGTEVDIKYIILYMIIYNIDISDIHGDDIYTFSGDSDIGEIEFNADKNVFELMSNGNKL